MSEETLLTFSPFPSSPFSLICVYPCPSAVSRLFRNGKAGHIAHDATRAAPVVFSPARVFLGRQIVCKRERQEAPPRVVGSGRSLAWLKSASECCLPSGS